MTNLLKKAQQLSKQGKRLKRHGQSLKAEAAHRHALEIRERELGPLHLETLESLHSLATVYLDQARYAEAETLCRQILAREQQTGIDLGLDHATTLNHLAIICLYQDKDQEAEALFQQALAFAENEHEQESAAADFMPFVLNGLGVQASKRGQYAAAETFHRRALAIREQREGETTATASCLSRLVGVCLEMKRNEEAEALCQRALRIAEQELDPVHPDLAPFLNDCALIRADKPEEYQQAEELFRRAITLYEQALGRSHPSVAIVLGNLGRLLMKKGESNEAEVLLRRALTIQEEVFGPTHATLALDLSSLANLLIEHHLDTEAESLLSRALAIRLQVLGAEHPKSVETQETYDRLVARLNQKDEVEDVI